MGQLGMKHPSLGGMVTAIESKLRRESLHERFTEPAVRYLEACTSLVLREKCKMKPLQTKLLDKFNHVLIVDSSSWDVDPNLANVLPGSGGNASIANCKVQSFYEYKHGELSFCEITPGTTPDNKYAKSIYDKIVPMDLVLTDLGYYYLNNFQKIHQKGGFFVSRYKLGTTVGDKDTLESIPLYKILMSVKGNVYQGEVKIGLDENTRVSCRLICLRISEEAANKRRMKLKKEAKRKGRTPGEQSLMFASWTIMITNVPEEWIPAEMIWYIYSIRWQRELLFKQMKSIVRIHDSNTAKIHRLKCEIYGKIIMAIIIHRIHGTINATLWNSRKRELSMEIFYKRIQERAFKILELLLTSLSKAITYVSNEVEYLIKNCMKGQQRSRKSSLQLIDEIIDLEVEELTAYA